MEKELTEVYCGNGKGKTALAIGQSLRVATQGKSVIVIQFLKGRDQRSLDFLQDVDNLDFKIFRFEKRECCYEDLTEEEKAEDTTESNSLIEDSDYSELFAEGDTTKSEESDTCLLYTSDAADD